MVAAYSCITKNSASATQKQIQQRVTRRISTSRQSLSCTTHLNTEGTE
ncbi:hypothetical protein EVA_07786 [gut metagenome]|uniref:Uncharacterized protein n=1 Tax=gut metagenome TaxID=749906 RepID=J9GB91_9ZZZZ